MPSFLANLRIHVVYEKLRVSLSLAKRTDLRFSSLASIIDKKVQRARYEEFLINLASALNGYDIWCPAFVDFRGRIYRTGYLNFHERDLARSLLLFSTNDIGHAQNMDRSSTPLELTEETYRILACDAYGHYQTPVSLTSSYQWVIKHCCLRGDDQSPVSQTEIMNLAAEAKNPYQFIASALRFQRLQISGQLQSVEEIPIGMDAESSAYQIISLFLLDEDLAKRTNLIGGDGDTIQDLYTSLIEPLSSFLKEELKQSLGSVVASRLTRKLIKKIYMPLVYGKSLMSSANDIKADLYAILKRNEHMTVAAAFYRFWEYKYPLLKNLMNLINLAGWFAAFLNKPVSYHTNYFQTIQETMLKDSVIVWVYDRTLKKRRKISISMPSTKKEASDF